MKITCISASNVEMARRNSASTRVCEMIGDILLEEKGIEADVQIIPLLDYDLTPCRMCGDCYETGRCIRDEAFNHIYRELTFSDGIFIVCPHYAPIPSKLMMILEKLEEMVYLNWCANPNYHFTLHKKPVGIIAHGRQTKEALPYYKTALLDPIAMALGSVQMEVLGVDEQWPNGVAFGVTSISQREDSIFVTIEHDWEDVRQRVTPLVENVTSVIARAAQTEDYENGPVTL